MTKNHSFPITPPLELVKEWARAVYDDEPILPVVAAKSAQWGADQELEACCEWMNAHSYFSASIRIREDRRPKPPSLKQEALIHFESYAATFETAGGDSDLIFKALKSIPDPS